MIREVPRQLETRKKNKKADSRCQVEWQTNRYWVTMPSGRERLQP